MAERWLIKTADGEEYPLRTTGDAGFSGYNGRYNLLIGTMGHHGSPITIQSDIIPNTAGSEFRQVIRGDRTVYLPLLIMGTDAADFHRHFAKLRKSLDPDYECQLWITNNEGETRVLYARYLKGFESTIDDEKRGPNWIKVPLYLLAEDPFFYDPPGSELTRVILADPFSALFLTPTVFLTNLSQDASASTSQFHVDSSTGFATGQTIHVIGGGFTESFTVSTVGTGTITITGQSSHPYTVANGSYIQLVDSTEVFLTSGDSQSRTVNDGCEYVIFWMRGCPPCLTALTQLANMQLEHQNITVTKVEIHDADASVDGIGMTAAQSLYPEAYAFAMSCGPTPPAVYDVIDGVMPAVIALYRKGIFVQAWCGVHTTGADPVTTNELLDACGPRVNWRISRKYLGQNIVIDNTGDDIAYPVWTINGPGSNLHLTNVTTGDDFLLRHNILAGETIVIDTREGAHTCGSTNKANFQGIGYWENEQCPTCKGTGAIPAECCGGWQTCPTCKGTGKVQVWVPSASGSTTGKLFNLRPQIDQDSRVFWGFVPGPNVILVELTGADLHNSRVRFSLVRRYEGV